jgi:hypothetical protein
MNNLLPRRVGIALIAAMAGLLMGCQNEKKPESTGPSATGMTSVMLVPGEAGGVAEQTFTIGARVSAIETSSRKVTLTGDDGSKGSFTAPPEMRNFDQLKVGDHVKATIAERLVIFVRSGGEDPSVTHAAALAAAPKGAKPGALAAESYELVATVKSLDRVTRKATLAFVDGATETVTARADVDLTKYNPGDSVIIRVTAVLIVAAESP